MNKFSAEWLALREPADVAARDGRAQRLAGTVAQICARGDLLRVLDLGAGTGSNLRYTLDRVTDRYERQEWLLVDHDAELLTRALAITSSWGASRGFGIGARASAPWDLVLEREGRTCLVGVRQLDIRSVGAWEELVPAGSLVTASALLDLVSDDWLARVTSLCRKRNAAVLFALTYDGRLRCFPPEPEDGTIQDLVNRHQRTDKGFGRALGPEATSCAERRLAQLGYWVEREPSDWMISGHSPELQRQLVEGWVRASIEMEPAMKGTIQRWCNRRLRDLAEGDSRILVGHQDLAGWLR
ncbi:MAG: SAM-dependent methyltransferase [Acidobacteria bacterium]|nr:MAG: SAM-dependent methyltransferase [Acidobacteriota bacterium]